MNCDSEAPLEIDRIVGLSGDDSQRLVLFNRSGDSKIILKGVKIAGIEKPTDVTIDPGHSVEVSGDWRVVSWYKETSIEVRK